MTLANYQSRHGTYHLIFRLVVQRARPALVKSHDPLWLEAVQTESWQEFACLLPEVPYIGEHNVWEHNLILSALYLGLLRAARNHGASDEDSVQLLFDLHEAVAASLPAWVRRAAGRFWNSPSRLKQLRAAAARSQLRQYPADWVFTYIEGDGLSVPFGVDISECAILKYYRTQNEESYVPALCKLDFFLGKVLGFRFERAGTLADGFGTCDCRYYLNKETTDWNPRASANRSPKIDSDQAGLP